jgi:hypothetical protein
MAAEAPKKVLFAHAGRGRWGLAHTFGKKLYLTRDLVDADFIPNNLPVPKAPPKKASGKGKAKVGADGKVVQTMHVVWDRKRKFSTVPVDPEEGK